MPTDWSVMAERKKENQEKKTKKEPNENMKDFGKKAQGEIKTMTRVYGFGLEGERLTGYLFLH